VGIREALDVYSARAEWINGQTETLARKQTLNQALREMSLLLGRYPSLLNDVPDQLPDAMPALKAGLSSRLLERRPDVQAAYSEVLSQQSDVLVAGENRLPKFTLTASVGASSDRLSDVLRGDEFIWNVLGGITAPLFNAGKLEAEEQRQQHLLVAAIAAYRQTALNAFSEVEHTIDNDHLIFQQLTSAKETVRVSKQAEQQAFERYLAGLENVNTWLQAQRTAFDRTSRAMQLEVLYFQNRIQLHQALGGGFKELQSDD
jgi:outer membrane protein TolC